MDFVERGCFVLGLSPLANITDGLVAVVLQWASGIVHQLGHHGTQNGHPMIGIQLWRALGASIYPSNQGSLPASTDIRRALGEPVVAPKCASCCLPQSIDVAQKQSYTRGKHRTCVQE
jgi:hypothetical protein